MHIWLTQMPGFTSTRPADQNYAEPAQPSFDPQFPNTTQVNEPHALAATHQMPYLGQPFEPRDAGYSTNPAPHIDARARNSPEVTSVGPYVGKTGEIFRLTIRSTVDYTIHQYSFTILFGNTATPATIFPNISRDGFFHFTVQTTVPQTGSMVTVAKYSSGPRATLGPEPTTSGSTHLVW